MILLLITFAKISLSLKVTKISNDQYEFESDLSFATISESEQKFQSFITTSQFQLKSNRYIYSAFPRSTDIITLNQVSENCKVLLFMLGDIQKEPSLIADGNKLFVTNIVHFSYAPLNEISNGETLQIDNISNKQEFQIAKNNDNMGIVYCFDNQEITFELTFQSLDYNEIETHKGFLQDNINIEESCIKKARTIYTYDLLKPFNFELLSKQKSSKVLLEHQKDNVISYYDLKVNQAYIERGQFIKISCTNQEIQDQTFLIQAIPERSDAKNTLKIAIIVISIIIGIGLIILAVILILIYCKKKNIVEEQNESQINLQNVFGGLQGHKQSDEENKPKDGNEKSESSLDDFKDESFQEQLMESIAKTEQYQFGSNIDFDTGKLKKASFDLSMENEGFLQYQQQKTKKKINLKKSDNENDYQIDQTLTEDQFENTDQDIDFVYQQNVKTSEDEEIKEQKKSQNMKQSKQSQKQQQNSNQKKSNNEDRDTLLNQQNKFYNQKQYQLQLQFQK